MKEFSQEARMLHLPYEKEDPYHALSMPVYNSVAYEFDTAEAMEEAFCGKTTDHTYSRITNPSVNYFESRVRSLTGALSVTALNSGMAAINNALMTIAGSGTNIVTSPHLFGNTYSLIGKTLASLGVEARFCDLTDYESLQHRLDDHTCAIYCELITNPQLEVVDLKQLSAMARAKNIPLIVDTTIIPFTHFKAKEWGIDIEIISTTKYISGGATGLGGLIIDYGTCDWSKNHMLTPWISDDNMSAFTLRLRKEIHRNLGSYMSPQAAYMQTLGLETLSLRYNQQSQTCLALAAQLSELDGLESVNYNGLEGNPFHEISKRQFGETTGAMLTFNLSSREACFAFMNRLKLIRRATNLFDNRTLAIHPASTIYGTFTEEQRSQMDISQKTIRLSVGLESVEDLYQDIMQALSFT